MRQRWEGPRPEFEAIRQFCEEMDGSVSETGWTMKSGGLKAHTDAFGRFHLTSPVVVELMLHPTEAEELGERAAFELACEALMWSVVKSRYPERLPKTSGKPLLK